MLLGKTLSLFRIVKFTWKADILMLLFCSIIYLIDAKLLPHFMLPIAFPALMGTAIAFFVGFNNNQAYDRWWEARIIWGGIVNDSRSWARNLIAYNQDNNATKRMIYRHIAFLYALRTSLRKYSDLDFHKYLSNSDLLQLDNCKHVANKLLTIQAHELKTLKLENKIDQFEFANLNGLIQNFCESMGKSERILNTIFPTNYIYFTKIFIWLFIALITLSTSSLVGASSIILGWMMGLVFNTIHLNGMNLMNPFEHNPSGIPLNSITRNIEINLLQELGEEAIPEPIKAINGEYIL